MGRETDCGPRPLFLSDTPLVETGSPGGGGRSRGGRGRSGPGPESVSTEKVRLPTTPETRKTQESSDGHRDIDGVERKRRPVGTTVRDGDEGDQRGIEKPREKGDGVGPTGTRVVGNEILSDLPGPDPGVGGTHDSGCRSRKRHRVRTTSRESKVEGLSV